MPTPPARRTRLIRCVPLALAIAAALPVWAESRLTDRIFDEKYLSALKRDSRRLRAEAKPAERSGAWLDVRCVLHSHSKLSHDSRGTEPEIVAAAKSAGVRAIFTTEHPTADKRWLTEGLHGDHDGVLFIPGAELSDGLLIWRDPKVEWAPGDKAADVLRKVQGTGAVAFIAHPEGRTNDADWELPPYRGMEIYNTHADAKDSHYEELWDRLKAGGPVQILSFLGSLKKYQMEAFASIFDEQKAVLHRWDTLNQAGLEKGVRVVGIAANDSHQNVGLKITPDADGLTVSDALDQPVAKLPKAGAAALLIGPKGIGFQFDPYAVSFGYVSTHLLAKEVAEDALFEALNQGRGYVAFDWMGDPSGFEFFGKSGERLIEMGASARVGDGLKLTARPNMSAEIRLLRNGAEVAKANDVELTYEVKDPGVYRTEVWVTVGSESRPWIYSNPIYVTSR